MSKDKIKPTDMERIWMSPDEAAIYLGVSAQTLANRRSQGLPPKYSKPAQKIYYFKEDLDKYLRGE